MRDVAESHFGLTVRINGVLPSISVTADDGGGEWFFQEHEADTLLEEAKSVEVFHNFTTHQAIAHMALNW